MTIWFAVWACRLPQVTVIRRNTKARERLMFVPFVE
jgi:hypothetical protein